MSYVHLEAGGVCAVAAAYNATTQHTRVDDLERAILDRGLLVPQPTGHLFLPGLYVRQVFNPAGSLVVTKIHKTEHPYFLLHGSMSIRDTVTGEVVHLQAPHHGVTKPGTRRIILAHTDVVFITVHPNPDNTQDLDLIESRLIERRELDDGKTSHELFNERIKQIADGCRSMAALVDPDLAAELPVDYNSINQHAAQLAVGENSGVPDDVIDEAQQHLGWFGLTMREDNL